MAKHLKNQHFEFQNLLFICNYTFQAARKVERDPVLCPAAHDEGRVPAGRGDLRQVCQGCREGVDRGDQQLP